MITQIDGCRICFSQTLEEVINLGQQALSGHFPNDNDTKVDVYPLILVKCAECGLVQLQHSIKPNKLYHKDYGYRSGINTTMRDHLASIVKSVESRLKLLEGDIVVDVASNDGTLLNAYANKKLKRIGVDPLARQFTEHYQPDIIQINDFFNDKVVQPYLGNKKVKVITSIAVFYDLERPSEFVKSVKKILDSDGCWVLEQSDLASMIRSNSFDTICHEHLEYFSISVVKKLLESHELRIFDAELNGSNGGSHRLYVCHKTANFKTNTNIMLSLIQKEQSSNLLNNDTYLDFMSRCKVEMKKLTEFVEIGLKNNKTFHLYGASTKGNVLLQFCRFGSQQIIMAADRNPKKWGCHTPGTMIPIKSEEVSRDLKPDYYIVLPWHFRDEFIAREADILKGGTSLIFPLPKFEIFSNDSS